MRAVRSMKNDPDYAINVENQRRICKDPIQL